MNTIFLLFIFSCTLLLLGVLVSILIDVVNDVIVCNKQAKYLKDNPHTPWMKLRMAVDQYNKDNCFSCNQNTPRGVSYKKCLHCGRYK